MKYNLVHSAPFYQNMRQYLMIYEKHHNHDYVGYWSFSEILHHLTENVSLWDHGNNKHLEADLIQLQSIELQFDHKLIL